MQIKPLGAAGGVTGSCYLIECGPSRILLDCGMFQGEIGAAERNADLRGIEPTRLDAVVLTHAHLDHCGRLPLITRAGFARKIWATPATIDLTELILLDSAHIQESDAERINRKRERSGEPQIEPLYTTEHALASLKQMTPLPLQTWQEVAPGIEISFHESGHILGSASVRVRLRSEAEQMEKMVVFSGDIGPLGTPLLRDFEQLEGADLVFLESTYGDRDHRPLAATIDELREVLERASQARSKVLIPSFAVGRAQQVLYHIAELRRANRCSHTPIYLDSPMAIKATELYKTHAGLLDKHARALNFGGDFQRLLPELVTLVTADQSRTLNDSWDPGIVIASSGMCEAGRIVHHLKHNLWKRGVEVLLVGYMGQGTLGRKLVEGASEVFIQGDRIAVRAKISTLGGLSAHAGQSDLLQWFSSLAPSKPKVALTHGEDLQRGVLSRKIRENFGLQAILPRRGEVINV